MRTELFGVLNFTEFLFFASHCSRSFHRTIPLSTEVVEDKIDATFKNGVLKVCLPKSPEAQKARKRISIH
ncbi:MAG: Hsp20/alpha crystallin family protein [Pedobacter sp.]